MEPTYSVHPIAEWCIFGELREGGLIAEREYDGLDPDYHNWYTLTETGSAVA